MRYGRLLLAWSFYILLVSLINGAYAISTDMKPAYAPGETMIIKISGNILEPIMPEQIEFKRNNVRIPFEYDIKNIGGNYYLWAIMPINESQKNYTLLMKGITATVNGNVQKIDFMQNFSIYGNLTAYTIKPGFIFTKSNFDITAMLNKDGPESININFLKPTAFELQPGNNIIPFSISDVVGTEIIFIQFGVYTIPAYIASNKSGTGAIRKYPLLVNPDSISGVYLITKDDLFYPLIIKNIGGKALQKISIVYNEDAFSLSSKKEFNLEPDQSAYFNLTLKNTENKIIRDVVYIQSNTENISFTIPISINLTKNASEIINAIKNRTSNVTGYYCSELSEKVCERNEVCSGEVLSSLDGGCCVGACEAPKNKDNSWIGYLIVILIIVVMVLIYYRYKKAGIYKNPLRKKIP